MRHSADVYPEGISLLQPGSDFTLFIEIVFLKCEISGERTTFYMWKFLIIGEEAVFYSGLFARNGDHWVAEQNLCSRAGVVLH